MTVKLRRYQRCDLGEFCVLFGDAEVMRYVGDGVPLSRSAAASLFERIFEIYNSDPSFFVWAVDDEGEYAGHAELKRRAGRHEYEIVYILQRARWGRSLGAKTVHLLIVEARSLGLPSIVATVHPENTFSLAILEKLGFKRDVCISDSMECGAYMLKL